MKVIIPTTELVIESNKFICSEQGNSFQVIDRGKIESALHTAFYPGSFPFQSGGIAKIAGALCFHIVMAHAFLDGNKRTGALVAITFMNENGWDLEYPLGKEGEKSALGEIVESCAASNVTKNEVIEWFDRHKIKLPA